MPSVIYQVSGHVARLTLNRPEAGNTINEDMAQELATLCQKINQTDGVYVVVLTGAGEDFCLGGEKGLHTSVTRPLATVDRPVIAAISGRCFGQGLELALSCDLRLSSEKAFFSMPHLPSGNIPSDGGTQFLPRIVGRGKAMEMLLGAETIDAQEAHRIGLVNRLLHADRVLAEAEDMAAKMATKGPIALRFAKEAINKGLDLTLEQGLRLEADLYFLIQTTGDRTEGIRAFLEKRMPGFKGE